MSAPRLANIEILIYGVHAVAYLLSSGIESRIVAQELRVVTGLSCIGASVGNESGHERPYVAAHS